MQKSRYHISTCFVYDWCEIVVQHDGLCLFCNRHMMTMMRMMLVIMLLMMMMGDMYRIFFVRIICRFVVVVRFCWFGCVDRQHRRSFQ